MFPQAGQWSEDLPQRVLVPDVEDLCFFRLNGYRSQALRAASPRVPGVVVPQRVLVPDVEAEVCGDAPRAWPQRLTVSDVEEVGLNACLCQALREVFRRVRCFLHTSQEVLQGSDLGDPRGELALNAYPC